MADSWMDHIPTHEREKIRHRMRSPEAYEALRDRVKGPEDLAREMKRNEQMADLSFAIETQPNLPERLKSAVEQDVREQGIDAVLEGDQSVSPETRAAIEQGKFEVRIQRQPKAQDRLVIVPEGNVTDKFPIKPTLSDRYTSQLTTGDA